MRPGALLAAAAEVLDDILTRHRPAATALADWGKSHRFAGSGDRSAIGSLVYDALRRRQSITARMGEGTPRALVLGAAGPAFDMTADEIAGLADGSPHALPPLSEGERAGLSMALPADAPPHIAGDIPEWLVPSFERAFGMRAAEEGAALASRAPVDMRVNTLKADREKLLKALQGFGAQPTPFSPAGVRIPPPRGRQRAPHVEAEPAHGKGWFEVQDEGSQIAALMTGARPRMQVLDLCAGAGGKTLAMSAVMHNTGQIYAYDTDKLQLRPIFERLKRAGARCVQVMQAGGESQLIAMGPRFDVVLVDAPCSGSGTWRRRPDSKWRLRPEALAERLKDQREALTLAARMVKPGGRLVYVTCSLLPEENGEQIDWFLGGHSGFRTLPYVDVWRASMQNEPPQSADGGVAGLLLTPARHGTDGFFIATLERNL